MFSSVTTIVVRPMPPMQSNSNSNSFEPDPIFVNLKRGSNRRNTRLKLSADESAIFLDTAFNGKNTQTKDQEQNLFESKVTNYLNKFRNNLRISSLNINSLDKKFADILFLLNGRLVDIISNKLFFWLVIVHLTLLMKQIFSIL